jgi:hypothetical protein
MKRSKFILLLGCFSIFSEAGAQKDKGNWTNLFDGKTLNGWKQVTGTAKFEVINGEIVGEATVGTVNSFLATEKTYKDFILELETKIEDSTMNSGVQIRSHLDQAKGRVAGLQCEIEGTSRKWSGGIYDEQGRLWLYPVTLNPKAQDAFQLNGYNKVRIECKGNIICTWLNGQPVSYLIDSATGPGFIALQVHNTKDPKLAGKKVHWKNIRIRTSNIKLTPFPRDIFVVNTLPNNLSEQEKKNGWKLLFDGGTSAGWKGAYQKGFPEKGWEISNGEFKVLASGGQEATNGGDIVTVNEFSAFDLVFDFKFSPGANSGVKYFVTLSENNKGSAIGLEYQVLDDTLHPDAKMGRNGNRTLASIYDLIPAVKQSRFINQPGNWNRGRIVVYPNNHVEHWLNGIKVLEYDRGSTAYRDLVAISKYKIWPNFGEAPKGHILIQDHGNEVNYRSIKIRELK